MGGPRLALLGAAALFSTGGAVIKVTTLSAWQVAGLRSAVAAAVLLALRPRLAVLVTRRAWPVALGFAATLTLFVSANKLATAADAIFLQSTAPLYVLLLSPWLLRERPRRADLMLMVALSAGLALVLSGATAPSASAPDPRLGRLLAAGAGLGWALTLMGLRAYGARSPEESLVPVVLGNLLGAACLLPVNPDLSSLAAQDALAVTWLGAAQIALAYVLLTRGLSSVSALQASLLLLAEPALSPVWAWALHDEVPGPSSLWGGLVILGSTVAWMGATRGSEPPDRSPLGTGEAPGTRPGCGAPGA